MVRNNEWYWLRIANQNECYESVGIKKVKRKKFKIQKLG
jgi:hypothetical protein